MVSPDTTLIDINAQIKDLIRRGQLAEALSAMKVAPAYEFIGATLEARFHDLLRRHAEGTVAEELYTLELARLNQDVLLGLNGGLLWLEKLETPSPAQTALGDLVSKVVKGDLSDYYESTKSAYLIPQEFHVDFTDVQGSWGGDSEPPQFAPGVSLEQFFQQMDYQLLLLGPAGSGKSFTLKRIAAGLLQRAQVDPASPVPVILNLTNWRLGNSDLAAWIVGEISSTYLPKKEFVRTWLDEGRILLLLDSLDTVAVEARTACIDAINRFRNSRTLPGLVVASRDDGYRELGHKLQLQAAVHLAPLTPQIITSYLSQAAVGSAELQAAVTTDNGLLELAKTPLALRMLADAFSNTDRAELVGRYSTDRRGDFYEAYLDKVFAAHPSAQPYSERQIRHWLSWMACGMRQNNIPIYRFENLQPVWLMTRRQRLIYFVISRVMLGLVAGTLGGPIIGLGLGLEPEYLREHVWRGVIEGMSGGIIGGIVVGLWSMLTSMWNPPLRLSGTSAWTRVLQVVLNTLVMAVVAAIGTAAFFGLVLSQIDWCRLVDVDIFCCEPNNPFDGCWGRMGWLSEGVSVGLVVGLSFGLVFGTERDGVPRRVDSDIQAATLEKLAWSSRRVPLFCVIAVLLGGLAGVIIHGVSSSNSNFQTPITEFIYVQRFSGMAAGIRIAALCALFCGLATALIAGLSGSTVNPKERTGPNQAIMASLQNALWVGGVAAVVLAVAGFLIGATVGWGYASAFGLYGFFIGYLVFLAFGGLDVWLHGCLRLLSSLFRYTPKLGSYLDFLRYCSELQLLYPIHGGYQFRHRTWEEFFAKEYSQQI
jgi:hypothetical protein